MLFCFSGGDSTIIVSEVAVGGAAPCPGLDPSGPPGSAHSALPACFLSASAAQTQHRPHHLSCLHSNSLDYWSKPVQRPAESPAKGAGLHNAAVKEPHRRNRAAISLTFATFTCTDRHTNGSTAPWARLKHTMQLHTVPDRWRHYQSQGTQTRLLRSLL